MKAPIAQRRVTGTRRVPRGRRPRGIRAPLRRPLALLYRQSRMGREVAPALVRGADGRPVPLAPRLQIALHLSLTLNEQHSALPVPAAHLQPGEAGIGPPLTFGHPIGRGKMAQSSRSRSGHGSDRPVNGADIAPRWPLRQMAGTAEASNIQMAGTTEASSIARDLPGRLLVTRLGNRPAAVRPKPALRHASSDPAADHGIFAGLRSVGYVPLRVHGNTSRSLGNAPSGIGPSRVDRQIERPPPVRDERGVNRSARRSIRAGAAGHNPIRPDHPSSRLLSRLWPNGKAPLPRTGRIGPPHAANRLSTTSGGPAPASAILYLAERAGGGTPAPASPGSAWTPAPLDYRSAAPPAPAPAPNAESRPTVPTNPSDASVDLEAVSRGIISRIEKRLRVERERRGRT